MNQATDLAQAPTPAPPGNTISLILFAAAALLLGGLLAYVLLDGPAFNSFPGRTIGISLLSDIDPHYRIGLFLVLSAMLIVISWAGFTLSRLHPGWQRTLPHMVRHSTALQIRRPRGAPTSELTRRLSAIRTG